MRKMLILIMIVLSGFFVISNCQTDGEKSKLTEVWDPVPEIIVPGNNTAPPSDAIVLLGELDLSESSPPFHFRVARLSSIPIDRIFSFLPECYRDDFSSDFLFLSISYFMIPPRF